MTEREKILGRVREALKAQAPMLGSHEKTNSSDSAKPPASGACQWLPKVGESFEEQLALFQAKAAELKSNFQLLDSHDELKIALVKMVAAGDWQCVASHHGELTDFASAAVGLPVCWTDGGYDVREMEMCDVGISECDALIAQPGSVLVTNRSAGGRALSVLPPHHIVLARRDQLAADLTAAFELLKRKYGDNYPSMISFITGPSRTGDIERILVLGAHGPKKLTIFCL